MSRVYRGRFIAALKVQLPECINSELISALYKQEWVVYAKRPFAGPLSVLEYLGRYTHKIAISNHRIKGVADDKLSFACKDYKQGGVHKEMTLDALEFIRRFAMHILPKGFVRIRHFGIVSSTSKAACADVIKAQLLLQHQVLPSPAKTSAVLYNPKQCPCCKKDSMETIMIFNKRGPPPTWRQMAADLLECIV